MVNSEIGAHVRSNLCYLMCATCSELPSNINTMIPIVQELNVPQHWEFMILILEAELLYKLMCSSLTHSVTHSLSPSLKGVTLYIMALNSIIQLCLKTFFLIKIFVISLIFKILNAVFLYQRIFVWSGFWFVC